MDRKKRLDETVKGFSAFIYSRMIASAGKWYLGHTATEVDQHAGILQLFGQHRKFNDY